jgi:hypothetical protein
MNERVLLVRIDHRTLITAFINHSSGYEGKLTTPVWNIDHSLVSGVISILPTGSDTGMLYPYFILSTPHLPFLHISSEPLFQRSKP